ncbi:MAG: hypothetical protein U9N73_06660 [Candidatus Auribacterota bacterium]|nr:hypothetical protein [Candidatus Auribacterota bacterium]
MKKVTIVVQDKDREEALTQLSALGLVHIDHLKEPAGQSIERVEINISALENATKSIPESSETAEQVPVKNLPELIQEIDQLAGDLIGLRAERDKRNRLIDEWKIWGDFDVKLLRELNGKGIWVYLVELPEKKLSDLPDDLAVQIFTRKGGVAYCGIISDNLKYFYFKTKTLPRKRLSEMIRDQEETGEKMKSLEEKLAGLSRFRSALEEEADKLNRELEFEEARAGMEESGKLSYLQGYCPVTKTEKLEAAAKKNRWGLMLDDPEYEDLPPTLLTNPGWVRLIEPVFKLIDTVPGYREIDASFIFLVFFSLFFAMLIGDAGYGAVFLIGTGLAQWKLGGKLKDKKPIFLFYILSIATIIWGLLTGTIFGHEWLPQSVKPLTPWLDEPTNVMWLCFLIGAIQLTLAHLWKLIRKAPAIVALADLGWICIIWTMFFVAGMFILDNPFPAFGIWLLAAGLVLIIGFSIPPRYFFKDLFVRMITIFLSVINSFADVVSYIRLFAVGLATVAIADAFNNMAISSGWSSFPAGLISAIILLFGHTLNMILGGMAILVHGVRLNVLEFSSHLDMEWSGHKYNPFKGKKLSIEQE